MFAPEPEEKPRRKQLDKATKETKKTGPPIFGFEPEERPRKAAALRSPCPFADEPEEKPRRKRPGDFEIDVEESEQEDEPTEAATINVTWSGLLMFQRSRFLGAAAEQPPTKKRPYNNAQRAANAQPRGDDKSFKAKAMTPGRLEELKKLPTCKCALLDIHLSGVCLGPADLCLSVPTPLESLRCFADLFP